MLKIQHNNYRSIVEVSGFYKFKKDVDNVGENRNWHKGLTDFREIAVPASWNEQYYDLFDFIGTGWYERNEFIPEEWRGKTIRIRVGAATYQTKVWINGKFVGEHEGGSLPFEFDITDAVKCGGLNKLVISVDAEIRPDRLPPGNFPEGEGAFINYPPNNYDFYPYAGIHRTVYIYSLPKVSIDDMTVKTDIKEDDALISFNIKIKGDIQPSSGECKVKIFIDQELKGTFSINEDNTADGNFIITKPILWDTENPHLYTLKAALTIHGSITDEYILPIGVRTVTIEGRKLLLNGKPIFLKGVNKHEDFMVIGRGLNHALIIKDYDLLKWVGVNSFRTIHYPYSEEVLEYADRNGFLIIDETPFVGLLKSNYNKECTEKCKRIISEMVDRDKNHPSVIMWNVANEPASQEKESEGFFKELYNHFKLLDDTRPVTLTSFKSPEEDVAIKYFDVICVNRYFGWYVFPGQLDEANRALDAELENFNRAYPDKPIMVSEFGAGAIAGLHSEPPRQFTEEYQAEAITQQYEVIKSKDYIIGAHVWALADLTTSQNHIRVLGNKKGIFTRERQPKMAARALRKIWTKT